MLNGLLFFCAVGENEKYRKTSGDSDGNTSRKSLKIFLNSCVRNSFMLYYIRIIGLSSN